MLVFNYGFLSWFMIELNIGDKINVYKMENIY